MYIAFDSESIIIHVLHQNYPLLGTAEISNNLAREG